MLGWLCLLGANLTWSDPLSDPPIRAGWLQGATAQCKAIARPAALGVVSQLAVVLSLVAGVVGDRGHQPATVLRWLGTATLLLPRHHFATFLQRPQRWSFHLRQHNSPLHRSIAPSQ